MRSLNRAEYVMIWAVCLLLLGLCGLAKAEEPTLARLSFWAPPDRMAGLEAAYEEQVVPILKKHGLVESAAYGRATVDSVFCRLFKIETPAAIPVIAKALREDAAWQEVLQRLGTAFETPGTDRLIPYRFGTMQRRQETAKARRPVLDFSRECGTASVSRMAWNPLVYTP